jgi:hypothetical protein
MLSSEDFNETARIIDRDVIYRKDREKLSALLRLNTTKLLVKTLVGKPSHKFCFLNVMMGGTEFEPVTSAIVCQRFCCT